jgi:NitT/TauT family transport system substrate-binding protein
MAQAPMKLTLNFLAGGPQAGFMYAKKLGYYKDAGIDLTIEEGKGSATTAQLVATGQTDVGFADAPAAMQIRSKGAPVKIIAPILQTNGFAIITLEDSGIRTPKDLLGKRLAVQPGTAQTTLLDAILSANAIDKGKLDIVNIDPAALVGALLEKKVDAILAGADFQSVQIRDRGFKVRDILYRDVGVPTVGLSVIARDDRLKANPDLYKRFVAASLKGWDSARKDPEAASAAVIEQFPSVTRDQILKQLKVDLGLMCAPGATSLGRVPDRNWTLSFELLTKYLGLPKDKPIGDYYTNDFLPANAPTC